MALPVFEKAWKWSDLFPNLLANENPLCEHLICLQRVNWQNNNWIGLFITSSPPCRSGEDSFDLLFRSNDHMVADTRKLDLYLTHACYAVMRKSTRWRKRSSSGLPPLLDFLEWGGTEKQQELWLESMTTCLNFWSLETVVSYSSILIWVLRLW